MAIDKRRQVPVRIGANDNVHCLCARGNTFTQVLRHTAGDANDNAGIRVLVLCQFTDTPEHAFFRTFAHGTRVYQYHVGMGRVVCSSVSGITEYSLHQLGIGDIHLTTVRFEIHPRLTESVPIRSRIWLRYEGIGWSCR